ncbi:MAG: MetQ/NlpA family ABC transporter substrate-binding protein [Pseudomonadota bacterium]
MINIKKIGLLVCAILLTACGQHEVKNELKVGTIAGPDSQLMEVAKQVAKDKYGLNIDIVEFTDYVEPNTALNDGSINANMFQHQPYLNKQIQDRHYRLIAVGKTFVFPMGIYSKKVKTLAELPQGALVAIPNDPSNEGRALLLLQRANLISLQDPTDLYATPNNIKDNPKGLKFKELDAAQLARSLADVELAVINSNYAIPAGLSPSQDAIALEDSNSPYANIIVVRVADANDPKIKQLVAAIQSAEVLKAAKEIFNGQAIPAWQPTT